MAASTSIDIVPKVSMYLLRYVKVAALLAFHLLQYLYLVFIYIGT